MSTKKRLLDAVHRRTRKNLQLKKPKKFKLIWWIFAFLIIIGNFVYFGIISFRCLDSGAEILSLFRNGKFLILLQNNSELRSSGGFIGSYAILEIKNFEVKNLDFNTNIYSTDRAFTENNHIDAPVALDKTLHGQSWALRDSNYDASFPEAGKDIMNFYQKETGDKVDGVIGINGKLIIDLLKITGPIIFPKYNVTVSADNFYFETQNQVEREYFSNPENWAINEPKTILKDLYPEILKRALLKKAQVFMLIGQELKNKEIIFYFSDPLKEQIIKERNWAGEIPNSRELINIFSSSDNIDYLYICNNSYSANKSSLSIKEKIQYKIIESNDKYITNLVITRIHSGTNDWPDGKNINWLRAYVPLEAEFQSAKLDNQDVTDYIDQGFDLDKKYFGLEIFTEPGKTSTLVIGYTLPKTENYHLYFQKQPGQIGDELQVNFLGKIIYNGLVEHDLKIGN